MYIHVFRMWFKRRKITQVNKRRIETETSKWHLTYFDCNLNLYGDSMSQKQRYCNFEYPNVWNEMDLETAQNRILQLDDQADSDML